jgi:hypothetical protein
MRRQQPLDYQQKLLTDYISSLPPLEHWERHQLLINRDEILQRESDYFAAPSKAVNLPHLIGVYREQATLS